MAPASTAPGSDDESLSALSEVDERFLEQPIKLLPHISQTDKSVGRRKTAKTAGVDLRDKTHGRTALHKAASKGNIEKMKELIEIRRATIDITDNAGVTPLHDACVQGRADAVRFLIAAGAVVSPKDCEGDYPLLDAAQNDNAEICQILLDAGANPTMQNAKGMSALSEAEEGPLKDLLRKYSSKFDSPGQNRMRINDVLTLVDPDRDNPVPTAVSPQRLSDRARPRSSQLNIDSHGARKVDINGRDQLHQYVLEGDDDLVEQFLDIQDCDFKDNYGDTPLHAAARAGNAHICGLLLQHGAKVTIRNTKGNTALHEASFTAKNRDVIVALLDAGASSLAKNYENQLPCAIAAAELGPLSPEARLLEKLAAKERTKQEIRQKRRGLKRDEDDSTQGSAKSSPMNSPAISVEQEAPCTLVNPISPNAPKVMLQQASGVMPVNSNNESVHNISRRQSDITMSEPTGSEPIHILGRKRKVPTIPDDTPQDIAVTVATSTPPEIQSRTKQVTVAGGTTTQFLTEFRSKSTLSPIDSSIRGSPLPPAQIPISRARSPLKSNTPLQSEVNAANPPVSPGTPHRDKSNDSRHLRPSSPKRKKGHHQQGQISSTEGSLSESETLLPPSGDSFSSNDSTVAAIAQMGKDIVQAIERQNILMNAMLASINALVAAQRK